MSWIQLGVSPPLEPGEEILATRLHIPAACGKSWPSYRWSFPVPLLLGMDLYVTDRRVLLMGIMFGLIAFPFSQWSQGGETGHNEKIVEVSVKRGKWLGPYIEVISENNSPWIYLVLRSRRATVRYYVTNPEELLSALHGTR